jgi:hypothetical protein
MLHITNGDSAAIRIRHSGIEGETLAWQDVLHEGPVPAGLSLAELRQVRAGFIAAEGWDDPDHVLCEFTRRDTTLANFREHAEVVLWFEHDLYDQLQLIQLLDWFAAQDWQKTAVFLVGPAAYLGTLAPDRLRQLYLERRPVSPAQLALGKAAWSAFTSPDPAAIEALLRQDTRVLPFLAVALRRHLQQFPSTENGLSRSEAQALAVIAADRNVLHDACIASHHEQEESIFLGDTVFAWYLADLSAGDRPLLLSEDGRPLQSPSGTAYDALFWDSRVALTGDGRAVLEKRQDRVELRGIDRWLGGVHLVGPRARWRWDPAVGHLRPGN